MFRLEIFGLFFFGYLLNKRHMLHFIQIVPKVNFGSSQSKDIAYKSQKYWNINTGKIKLTNCFVLTQKTTAKQVEKFAVACLQNQLTEEVFVNEYYCNKSYRSGIVIRPKIGVADTEGQTAEIAWNDFFGEPKQKGEQQIFSQQILYFESKLTALELEKIATKIVANPLIYDFKYFFENRTKQSFFLDYLLQNKIKFTPKVETINLELSNADLEALSSNNVWALSLEEMQQIKVFYENKKTIKSRVAVGLNAPTDCELEILAQTWSEHCKHKEFNAIIYDENRTNKADVLLYSLFETYIKKATANIQKQLLKKNNDWLVKVFSDNAGVVKATKNKLFVWKVETHNSPSALDPYGGAITGILGNNRDPLGTGIGGAKLLFNTNVFCVGNPHYSKPLLAGQLQPKQLLEGLIKGVADGGNKSGIPTVNGAVVFDDRYSGKPLVYCGTGALMPYEYQNKSSWEKNISVGDRIVMAGGRVGKDGIHGATFSSGSIDEKSPASAVQIGLPITQKKLADFMEIASQKGWIKCSTDNGAGGLSSSVGELATITNGAVVRLEKVPLKYKGLQPWEIFVSESQERMTLAVEPSYMVPLFALAECLEVELSDIGWFSDHGFLEVYYHNIRAAYLDMDFLHNGLPTKKMYAAWQKPTLKAAVIPKIIDYNTILLRLLGRLNICSKAAIIRQYDHEVKGKTILKPLMGISGNAPQDAAVVRFGFDSFEGVAISNGILPRYGDIDAYEMSAGAFDEGIRQIISVGGRLPNTQNNDGVFWSVNDNFCVPNSDYHPTKNPKGKQNLAKLVDMCKALYDMAVYFAIPLTSGKDSMKNDFESEGVKISVPPTVLYSMAAKIKDVRQVVSSDFKAAGDWIYQLGETYEELGASEFYDLYEQLGRIVPKVRKASAKDLYLKVMQANELNLIASSHDLSDGGLAVAVAESAFGASLGTELNLDILAADLSLNAILFGESHSRFLVSVAPKNQRAFESILKQKAYLLGKVTSAQQVKFSYQKQTIIDLTNKELLAAWSKTLSWL